MNKLSAEFEAGVPLSPSEYEGLLEVEAANARMVGYRECEAIAEPSTNGHESFSRLDLAQMVTAQFIRKPGAKRWRLTERPHRHESLNHNPAERALVNKRKADAIYVKRIDGEKKRLPNNIPSWRLRMPSIDGFEDGYDYDIEDVVTTEAPKADPRNSWSARSAISFAEAVTVKVSKNRWEDPDKCLKMLELTGVLEQVVEPLDTHGATNGVEIVYASQLDSRSYIAGLFT